MRRRTLGEQAELRSRFDRHIEGNRVIRDETAAVREYEDGEAFGVRGGALDELERVLEVHRGEGEAVRRKEAGDDVANAGGGCGEGHGGRVMVVEGGCGAVIAARGGGEGGGLGSSSGSWYLCRGGVVIKGAGMALAPAGGGAGVSQQEE